MLTLCPGDAQEQKLMQTIRCPYVWDALSLQAMHRNGPPHAGGASPIYC